MERRFHSIINVSTNYKLSISLAVYDASSLNEYFCQVMKLECMKPQNNKILIMHVVAL